MAKQKATEYDFSDILTPKEEYDFSEILAPKVKPDPNSEFSPEKTTPLMLTEYQGLFLPETEAVTATAPRIPITPGGLSARNRILAEEAYKQHIAEAPPSIKEGGVEQTIAKAPGQISEWVGDPKELPGAIGRGLAEGLTVEIPRMAGQAAQYLGANVQGVNPVIAAAGMTGGQKVQQWAEQAEKAALGERPEYKGLAGVAYEGSKMLAPSIIPAGTAGAAARIGLAGLKSLNAAQKAKIATNIASLTSAGFYGTSTAQDVRARAKEKGVDPGLHPEIQGAIEALGEYVGTRYMAKLLGLDENAIRVTLENFIKTLGVENTTEFVQQLGQSLSDKYSGIRPDARPMDEAIQVIGPTTFMTVMTAGAGKAAEFATRIPEGRRGLPGTTGREFADIPTDTKTEGLDFSDILGAPDRDVVQGEATPDKNVVTPEEKPSESSVEAPQSEELALEGTQIPPEKETPQIANLEEAKKLTEIETDAGLREADEPLTREQKRALIDAGFTVKELKKMPPKEAKKVLGEEEVATEKPAEEEQADGERVATKPELMTPQEYIDDSLRILDNSPTKGKVDREKFIENRRKAHKELIQTTIEEGGQVYSGYEKDYPELAKSQQREEQKTPAVQEKRTEVESEQKPAWEIAEERVRPYAENLRNLSDKELRAEDKKISDAINEWARNTPSFLPDGTLNPKLGRDMAYFELSAKLEAIGKEQDKRKGTAPKQPKPTDHAKELMSKAADMTSREFGIDQAKELNDVSLGNIAQSEHRNLVEKAAKQGIIGKGISEYPDLASNYGEPTATPKGEKAAETPEQRKISADDLHQIELLQGYTGHGRGDRAATNQMTLRQLIERGATYDKDIIFKQKAFDIAGRLGFKLREESRPGIMVTRLIVDGDSPLLDRKVSELKGKFTPETLEETQRRLVEQAKGEKKKSGGKEAPAPLTQSKLEEAAEAAPKAGLTLKEQKKTLLDDLKGARDAIINASEVKWDEVVANWGGDVDKLTAQFSGLVTDKTKKAVADAGFKLTKDGNRLVSKIPGDGVFYTSLSSLIEKIDLVEKRFPTSDKPKASELPQRQRESGALSNADKIARQSNIGRLRLQRDYDEAVGNLREAERTKNRKAVETFTEQVAEAQKELLFFDEKTFPQIVRDEAKLVVREGEASITLVKNGYEAEYGGKKVKFDSEDSAEDWIEDQIRKELEIEQGKQQPPDALRQLTEEDELNKPNLSAYKSVEELSRDYEILYHGGSKNIIGNKLVTGGRVVGEVTKENLGKGQDYGGIFFTPEKELARTFARHTPAGDEGGVHTFLVKKSNLFDETNPKHRARLRQFIGKKYQNVDGEMETFTQQMHDFIFPQLEDGRRHMDWATFDPQVLEAIGFDGAKVIENYSEDGKHLYSTVLFRGGQSSPHWLVEHGATLKDVFERGNSILRKIDSGRGSGGISTLLSTLTPEARENVVVTTRDNAPEGLHKFLDNKTKGIYYNGKVYLFENADARTFFHEIRGHYNLRQMFGMRLDPFLDKLWNDRERAIKNAEWYNRYTRTDPDVYNPNTAQGKRNLANEYIAHLSENQDRTTWEKLIAWLRSALRNIAPNIEWTDAELKKLIADGYRKMQKTPQKGTAVQQAPIFRMDKPLFQLKDRKFVAVGIKIGDKVYRGNRGEIHADLLPRMTQDEQFKYLDNTDSHNKLDGFIDDSGQFVSRQEASREAKRELVSPDVLRQIEGDEETRDIEGNGRPLRQLSPESDSETLARLKPIIEGTGGYNVRVDSQMGRPVVYFEHKGVKDAEGKSVPTTFARFPETVDTPEKINAIVEEKNADYQVLRQLDEGIDTPMGDVTSLQAQENYDRIKRNLDSVKVKILEKLQDNWVRVDKLLQDREVVVTDENNPYQQKVLYAGRVQDRMDKIQNELDSIDKAVLKTAKERGLSSEELWNDINLYLHAKHAPERNAVHGERASGMSDEDAQNVMNELQEKGEFSDIQRLGDQLAQASRKGLEILRNAQLISEEKYSKLRELYPNHVPLNRVMDDTGIEHYIAGGEGFNVYSSGLKRAKGSERQVADIAVNIATNLATFSVRAEKNLVDLATLQFSRDNAHLGLFEEIKPKAIGKRWDGSTIFQEIRDPLVLHLYENGKPVYLRIKDASLARAFQNINIEKLHPLFHYVAAFGRLYSGLATRFNPEFWPSNKIRDLEELLPTIAAAKGLGGKAALKAVGRDILMENVKAVSDYVRGKDTEGARLYAQMKADGGTTGGLALSTRKDIEINLEKLKRLNRSGGRRALNYAIQTVDHLNQIFEDSTRLSVYRTALEMGMTRKQAAFHAKNSTIDFNRKGEWGGVINALYIFSNASIQGSVKMLRAMKNPKVATAVTLAVATAVFLTAQWNDEIDEDWRDKVSKWDRLNGLPILIPSDEGVRYITIPVSWGLKPIKAMVDNIYDLSTGNEESVKDAVGSVLTSVIDAYNPLGGSDVVSAITPTVLDLPVDLARNKTWSGSMIRPHDYGARPRYTLYFKSLEKSAVGQGAIATARRLDDIGIEVSPADIKYVFDQATGGTGRFLSKVITSAASTVTGELPTSREAPFAGRFYRDIPTEELGARRPVLQRITEQEKRVTRLKIRALETGSQPDIDAYTAAKRVLDDMRKASPEYQAKLRVEKDQREARERTLRSGI